MEPVPATCNYTFPVSTFQEAVTFAQAFTDLTISTLIDIQRTASEAQDHAVVSVLGSILGAKSEQASFFRFLPDKLPTGRPFLPVVAPAYLFNTVSRYIELGSCPLLAGFQYPTFQPFQILQGPRGSCEQGSMLIVPNGTCNLSILLGRQPNHSFSPSSKGMKVVYMNGLMDPFYENFTVFNHTAELITAEVSFPVNRTDADVLTVLAVTQGENSPANADEIVRTTKYGPGLLEYEFMYGN